MKLRLPKVKLLYFLKVTVLVSARSRIGTQTVWPRAHVLNCLAKLPLPSSGKGVIKSNHYVLLFKNKNVVRCNILEHEMEES